MSDITYYQNSCPFCDSIHITFFSVETDGVEEKKLKCDKCGKTFEVNEAKKKRVGDTQKI